MTDWSGVVDTQYGTIVLAEPDRLPPGDIDVDRLLEDRCVAFPGGLQILLPDQNGLVPTRVRVLEEPGAIEDAWEHVAEIGFVVPGGRLLLYSWMPDEDLAADIIVPTEPLIARIHWTGLSDWLRLVEAGRHLEAGAVVRLRVDLVRGEQPTVTRLRTWEGWATPAATPTTTSLGDPARPVQDRWPDGAVMPP